MGDLHEENTETGVPFPRASKCPSNQLEVFQALRDLEQRAQIKRILPAENPSREIQESGINPDKTSLNSISSFGSRIEQISASRKPLFLDTTLCLKEPAQETMITQGQESCLHTPVWGVEGFNISTSKEVEGELTTGKQLTRVFNGLVEENTTDDTAMTNTINFDDLLLEETVFVSTSIAPMDMIEEAGGGGAGVDHLAREEHPPAGCFQEHAGRGGPVQEKDPRAGFRSEKLKYNRSR